jgi:hypothetical protein
LVRVTLVSSTSVWLAVWTQISRTSFDSFGTYIYLLELGLLASQDSTVLWETLPVHVMDLMIKMHHSIMRKELLAHQG